MLNITQVKGLHSVVSAQFVGAGIIMMAPPFMGLTQGLPNNEERVEWLVSHIPICCMP
jgi:hypothetical protein